MRFTLVQLAQLWQDISDKELPNEVAAILGTEADEVVQGFHQILGDEMDTLETSSE